MSTFSLNAKQASMLVSMCCATSMEGLSLKKDLESFAQSYDNDPDGWELNTKAKIAFYNNICGPLQCEESTFSFDKHGNNHIFVQCLNTIDHNTMYAYYNIITGKISTQTPSLSGMV